MTVTDPIPTTDYGKGNWQDYISNWRQKDAGWVQERSVLRYATAATRNTEWPSPKAGQVTYRGDGDRLEMFSGLRSSWVGILMFAFLTSVKDDAAGVNISHTAAAGKGAQFTPTNVIIDLPVDIYNGLLTAGATGVGVQTTGQKKALLTTAGAGASGELVSDTNLAVPSLRMTAGAGVIDATGKVVTVGALTATAFTVPNITMTGTLGGGGVLNGASATIGGVGIASNKVTASAGLQVQGGLFYGDANTAIMRFGTGGGAQVQVNNGGINFAAPFTDVTAGPLRLLNNQPIQYYYSANSATRNIAPSFYSGGDLGAANFPDGTIWVT